jgi:hypothetical protein
MLTLPIVHRFATKGRAFYNIVPLQACSRIVEELRVTVGIDGQPRFLAKENTR